MRCQVTIPVYAYLTNQPPSQYATRLTRAGELGTILRQVDHQTYIVRFDALGTAPVHASSVEAAT
jgi:hypothetical protein